MAPNEGGKRTRRVNEPKIDPEQMVCKRKLDALEQQESQSKEDRFTFAEKKQLLEAYNKHGFQVFQDVKLLQQFFPNRSESDLAGLLQRLKYGLGSMGDPGEDRLAEWNLLCTNLMGNFARDKRVNIDNAIADALEMVASSVQDLCDNQESSNAVPNYPELLKSFSQLLTGKFPINITKANAKVSMKLYEHINWLVESSDLLRSPGIIEDGLWLKEATDKRTKQLEEAKKTFENLPNCPRLKDTKVSLFLELPKMKRITEFLNPLRMDPDELVDRL